MRIDEWLRSIQDNGFLAARIASKAKLLRGADVIERIAETLIVADTDADRRILSKSLQEALLYSIDLALETDYADFKARLVRHMRRRGPAAVLQSFLGLYFFNFVWLNTSESFRSTAATPESFIRDLEQVEQLCREAVEFAWKLFYKSYGATNVLDAAGAEALVRMVDSRLCGFRR